jgi:hypothetical protein
MRERLVQTFAQRHRLIVSLSHCLITFFFAAPLASAVTVTAEVQPSEARPNQQFSYSIVIENGSPDVSPGASRAASRAIL